MATELRTELNVVMSWLYRNIDTDSGRETRDANAISIKDVLENGVVLDTADKIWYDRRTVNDAANDDLDLSGGVTDAFGTALSFAKVKGLLVNNRNTTAAQNLLVGGGSAPLVN